MRADFDAAHADDNLIDRRDDAAVAKARAADLLARVDTGESGELWRAVKGTWTAGNDALKAWNASPGSETGQEAKATFFQAWEEMGTALTAGVQDYQAWNEWANTAEQLRRYSETEIKRLKAGQDSLTIAEAKMYAMAIQQAVLKHVKDRDTLTAIATDLAILTIDSRGGRGIPAD